MPSNVTRMTRTVARAAPAQTQQAPQVLSPQQASMPNQQGGWFWNGSSWQCGDCDDGGQFPGCPPTGFPPPGCPPWFSGMNSPPWYPGANAGVSFGQTAPMNPVRGHFWFDGNTLWLFDGAAWVSVGGATGATTEPTLAVQTSTLTTGLTASTWAVAPINGVASVGGSDWNGANHIYQPKVAGLYQFEVLVWVPTAQYTSVALLLNDTGGPYANLNNANTITLAAASTIGWIQNSGIAFLNGTSDFVRVWCNPGGGEWDQSYGHPTLQAFKLP